MAQSEIGQIAAWHMRYARVGLFAVPVASGDKVPLGGKNWNKRAEADLWRLAGGDSFKGNIGLHLGHGGIAVVDCDTPETVQNVTAYLAGLGVSPADLLISATPSDGRHFYLRTDAPRDFNWGKLSPQIGGGELRGWNSIAVAPCSAIGDRRYRFLGNRAIEEWEGQKRIAWRDVFALAGAATAAAGAPLESLPVRLIRRELDAETRKLFLSLSRTPKGQPVYNPRKHGTSYANRSDAEAAAVTTLALFGWDYSEIRAEFDRQAPGHYLEYKTPAQQERYLQLTYRRALGDIAENPIRKEAADLYREAEGMPWPGRSGGLDRAVYLGLLSKVYQFGTWDVRASLRELAEHAGASVEGVSNALKRLQRAGKIVCLEAGGLCEEGAGPAGTWQIVQIVDSSHSSLTGDGGKDLLGITGGVSQNSKNSSAPLPPTVTTVNSADASPARPREDTGELWGRAGLGRSAGAVYHALSDTLLSVAEIAEATGKCRQTIYSALKKLTAHAKYPLAVREGRKWRRGPASLREVAIYLGCYQAAARRRQRHDDDRERLARRFADWRRRQAVAAAEALAMRRFIEARRSDGARRADDWGRHVRTGTAGTDVRGGAGGDRRSQIPARGTVGAIAGARGAPGRARGGPRQAVT